MTDKFPHHYHVSLEHKEASQGELSANLCPKISGGPPPEFGGQADWWSPEHLLLASTNLCLMTTFTALAKKEALQIVSYHCDTEGVLEKSSQGLVFTSITLSVKLRVEPAEVERAERILRLAERYCIISRSLSVPVTLLTDVSGAANP